MTRIIANPDPAKVISRASECMRRLMEAGISFDELQSPITNPDMRERLVKYWKSGGYSLTENHKKARDTMGSNFVGIEDAVEIFKITPTNDQLRLLSNIMFKERDLILRRDRHVLIPIFPLPISYLVSKFPSLVSIGTKFRKSDFYTQIVSPKWVLVEKEPIIDSYSSTWEEQRTIFQKKDKLTNISHLSVFVLIYTFILCRKKYISFCHNHCSRCNDSFEDNKLIVNFGKQISLCTGYDSTTYSDTGILSVLVP